MTRYSIIAKSKLMSSLAKQTIVPRTQPPV